VRTKIDIRWQQRRKRGGPEGRIDRYTSVAIRTVVTDRSESTGRPIYTRSFTSRCIAFSAPIPAAIWPRVINYINDLLALYLRESSFKRQTTPR
jgi:hypothetical protein